MAQELIPLRFQPLLPFDVVCVMPERTPLWAEILQQLPRLRMIASAGGGKRLDGHTAAVERRILVTTMGCDPVPTIEHT